MKTELKIKEPGAIATLAESAPSMRLLELAIQQGTGIEQLEKLMALQERWEAREAEKAFYSALSKFQRDCPTIKKTKKANFGGAGASYFYASIDDITEQIRPVMEMHGLSYRFEQATNDQGCIRVRCVLTHLMGHSASCELVANPDESGKKNAIQAVASSVTYLRRYTLTGVLGIATADQDIDGRLPNGAIKGARVASVTLANIIEESPTDAIEQATEALNNANDTDALNIVREMINGLPRGSRAKQTLKDAYMEKWSAINGQQYTQQGATDR